MGGGFRAAHGESTAQLNKDREVGRIASGEFKHSESIARCGVVMERTGYHVLGVG